MKSWAIINSCSSLAFFLLFTLVGYTQTETNQSYYNGLHTIKFNSNYGKITVYVPEFSPNENFSGAIILEPSGSSNKRKAKNLKTLKSYELVLNDKSMSLSSSSYNITNTKDGTLNVNLNDNKGRHLISTQIRSKKKNKTAQLFIPAYMVIGDPAKISAEMDGILNNNLTLNDQEVLILAETETDLFFRVPNINPGTSRLSFDNNGEQINESTHILRLDVSVGKLNLMRSEQTALTIEVTGLDGLESSVPLNITNNSTANISLENGNIQQVIIVPESDAQSGSYTLVQTIQAISNGGFSISAGIEPLNSQENETNNDNLCHCVFEGQTALISSTNCEELGGHCQTEATEESYDNAMLSSTDRIPDFEFNIRVILSYTDDIDDLNDDIENEWEKWEEAEHIRDSLRGLHSDLIRIDKILDRIPDVYGEDLKKAIDALEEEKSGNYEHEENDLLDKAIIDAQADLDACKKRISQINKTIASQQKELDDINEELDDLLEDLNNELDNYCLDKSCIATIEIKHDGTFRLKYKLPKDASEDDLEYIGEFTSAINKLINKQRRLLKKHKQSLAELKDAQDDCSKLTEVLERAKEAKSKSDYIAALEAKVEEKCEEIKRLLKRLMRWCKNHPDHCDFFEDLESILRTCPKTNAEYENFIKAIEDLISKKKALEVTIGEGATRADNDMEDSENKVSELEDEIRDIKQAEAERRQRKAEAAAKKAAEAKAAADKKQAEKDKRERDRKKQKKDDDKLRELVKKAQADDAGDEAFQDLLESMGLSLLDEATGDTKLGTIIGGLLAAKEIPDCSCKLMKALLEAISGRDRLEGVAIHVEAYIRLWEECANLTTFPASVAIGGNELTKAIESMTDEQASQAKKALAQAIRIQCKD